MQSRNLFALMMVLLGAGLAQHVAFSAPAQGATPPKLLLQDLVAQGVTEAEASVLTTSTCLALSKVRGYDALCGDDLRALMKFGTLSATFRRCEGEACFAQVTKAMNARVIVSGAVSRLGDLYLLSLSAVDRVRGKVLGRTEVKAPTLEQLQLQVSEAVSDVLARRRDDGA